MAGICSPAKEPLFETLGNHTHAISTSSPEAQRYFDQGLRFLFGFNHGAAIRAFQEAARLDPPSDSEITPGLPVHAAWLR